MGFGSENGLITRSKDIKYPKEYGPFLPGMIISGIPDLLYFGHHDKNVYLVFDEMIKF